MIVVRRSGTSVNRRLSGQKTMTDCQEQVNRCAENKNGGQAVDQKEGEEFVESEKEGVNHQGRDTFNPPD